jgi:hypothetical protein
MATPRTIARVVHDKNTKDWIVMLLNDSKSRYATLPEALTFADTLFVNEGDTITVHYPDRRIELLFAPNDLFQTLLRNR